MIKEFQGKYRWLSNFYFVPIQYDGKLYPSVEHAYMSAKNSDPEWKAFCADSNNKPGDVKKRGRNIQLHENWEEIKLQIMENCLRIKFNQEPFKSQLLATGDQEIQEGNDWRDLFWGVDNSTRKGKNNLGKLIMKIREELKTNAKVI